MHPNEFKLRAEQFASIQSEAKPLSLKQDGYMAPSSTPKSRRDKAMKWNKVLQAKKCVVCGARVRNQNPRTTTCDAICTAARNNGKTREQQVAWELEHPSEQDDAGTYCRGCGMYSSQCQCWDTVNGDAI